MNNQKFDKIKYDNDFAKKNYKNFGAKIKPDLHNRIDEYCKAMRISKPEFLERAIKALEDSYNN